MFIDNIIDMDLILSNMGSMGEITAANDNWPITATARDRLQSKRPHWLLIFNPYVTFDLTMIGDHQFLCICTSCRHRSLRYEVAASCVGGGLNIALLLLKPI